MNQALAKAVRKAARERLEATFALLVRGAGLPPPVAQVRFHPEREWRYDFGYPEQKLLIDVQGGTWLPGGGGHNRAKGYQNDCAKMNAAVVLGYRVLWFTTDDVTTGRFCSVLADALAASAQMPADEPQSPQEADLGGGRHKSP